MEMPDLVTRQLVLQQVAEAGEAVVIAASTPVVTVMKKVVAEAEA